MKWIIKFEEMADRRTGIVKVKGIPKDEADDVAKMLYDVLFERKKNKSGPGSE